MSVGPVAYITTQRLKKLSSPRDSGSETQVRLLQSACMYVRCGGFGFLIELKIKMNVFYFLTFDTTKWLKFLNYYFGNSK